MGLPGTGKTTLARRLESERRAVRLSPDEWMLPLFGESDPGGLRDVLEGRLVWVAYRALVGGSDVVLDFGLWGRDERTALAHVAWLAGAACVVHSLDLDERTRLDRIAQRWAAEPGSTFAMSEADHARHVEIFDAPDEAELRGEHPAAPPAPYDDWADWASARWPSLPRLSDELG